MVGKKDNQYLFWVLRIFLALVLFAIVSYALPGCTDFCGKLPFTVAIFLFFTAIVIFLVIAVVLKSPLPFTGLVLAVLLIYILFVLGLYCWNPVNSSIYISNGLYAGSKLHAGSSELELKLENHDVDSYKFRINGIKCIRTAWSFGRGWGSSTPNFIEPMNESIKNCTEYRTSEGSKTACAYIYKVYCKNENGFIPSDTSPGTAACFDIYFNYSNGTDGRMYITVRKLSTEYESSGHLNADIE
jgi:hypothetical protein